MKGASIVFAIFCTVAVSQNVPAWVEGALSFQRKASQYSQVDLIASPCAHNAYNNPHNLPAKVIEYQSLRIFDGKVVLQNQDYNMTDLLNFGVRHISIDAHYIPEYDEVLMCHGAAEALELCPIVEGITGDTCKNSIGFEDLGDHTGCTKDALTWRNGLIIISDFVAKHSDEFFLIEVENKVDSSNITRLFNPLIELFGNYALTVSELNDWRSNNTGKWPTFQQMRNLGKNVIITVDAVTYGGIDIDLESALQFPDNQAKYFDSNNCKSTQSSDLSTSFSLFSESDIMVVFDILGISSNADGHIEVGYIDSAKSAQLNRCGYAMCLDRISPSVMSYYVWSWEAGKADVSCGNNLCPATGDNGWSHFDCTMNEFPHACQSTSDPLDWSLSSSSAFSTSVTCPVGFTFSYPKNPTENRNLRSISSSFNHVWLNIPLTQGLSNSTICTETIGDPNVSSALSPYGFFMLSLATVFTLFALM